MTLSAVSRAVLSLVLASTAALSACASQPASQAATPPAAVAGPDISGVWVMAAGINRSSHPDTQWTNEKIPFTAAGRKAFDAVIPSAGPRQIRSGMSNDLQETGNPTGLIRDLMYSANGRNFEMLQHPDKVVQLFSAGRHWRIIYTDGRPVPDDVAAGPFWYGYSVGKWEGDTLVATTLSLDDRTWMDDWGLPTGPETRVEERWKREGNKLTLTLTISDPVFFEKPWTSIPTVYELTEPGTEPYEMIYAPVDLEHFNQTLLLPSAAKGSIAPGK